MTSVDKKWSYMWLEKYYLYREPDKVILEGRMLK